MSTNTDLPTFTHPHGWTWHDNGPVSATLHVEPAFLERLGDVFVRIDRDGQHLGIWLTRAVMEEFITAMRAAADPPEYDDEDDQ